MSVHKNQRGRENPRWCSNRLPNDPAVGKSLEHMEHGSARAEKQHDPQSARRFAAARSLEKPEGSRLAAGSGWRATGEPGIPDEAPTSAFFASLMYAPFSPPGVALNSESILPGSLSHLRLIPLGVTLETPRPAFR